MSLRVSLGILAAVLVVALLVAGYFSDPFGWKANLKQRAVVAEQGEQLATQTTAVVERVVRSEVTIHTQAERSVDAVQSATGADAPLDPELRARVCAGVAGLRNGSGACNDQPPPATP